MNQKQTKNMLTTTKKFEFFKIQYTKQVRKKNDKQAIFKKLRTKRRKCKTSP